MKNLKLGLITITICFSISIPILFFGFEAHDTKAYDEVEVVDIAEILFNRCPQEAKNAYNLNLVTVVTNNRAQRVLTNRIDIYNLLDDLGIVVNNNKRIVSTTENVQKGSVIRVISIGTVVEEITKDIAFKTEEVSTREIPFGERKVLQPGVLGVRTQHIESKYEDGILVSQSIIHDEITREPVKEIVEIGVEKFSISDLDKIYGYNCSHWYSVVDNTDYTDQEKQWLKFMMKCESGCKAENDRHSVYKGLFQWHPRYWYIFFPNDNIYDGYAQIHNTIWKVNDGVNLYAYWPACHRRYVTTYGEYIR